MSPRTPARPVFLSYRRGFAASKARALWEALGDQTVFLDAHDIEDGADFVECMVAALIDAQVIVVFAHEAYFESPYCSLEWEIAIRGYEAVVRRGGSEAEREAALDHIVIALPEGSSGMLERLPRPLQRRSWPDVADTPGLADLVRRRLEVGMTYRQRIADLVDVDLLGIEVEPVLHPPCNPARVARRALAGLPASTARRFLGRGDDLARLHRRLMGEGGPDGTPGSAVLIGGPGVGKTCLAAEYVHRYGAGHYPGGLFWVSAGVGDDDGLGRQFHAILRTFDKTTPDWKTFCDQERDVRSELRDHLDSLGPDERALFVVDDVPEPAAVERLAPFEHWCPSPGQVSLLVTSRVRLGELDQRIQLDVLSPQASRALLGRAVARPDVLAPGEWDEVSQWVGWLPLALQLLRAAIEDRTMEPHDLLEAARSSRPAATLDGLAIEADDPLRAPSITDAVVRSYERMPAEGKAAARLIAQMAPVPVPTALLKSLGPALAGPNRSVLVRRAYVSEVMADAGLSMFGRMHTLLADVLRDLGDDPEGDLRAALEGLTAVMTPAACRSPKAWPLLHACWPHARHLYDRSASEGRAPATLEAGVGLGMRLSMFLRSRGKLGEAATVAVDVALHAASALGESHRLTLSARSLLAEVRRAQGGMAEAEVLQRNVVRAAVEHLPPDDPDTARFQAEMAGIMADAGDRVGALAMLDDAVAAADHSLGPDNPVTLAYRSRQAAILAVDGRSDEAWRIQREVIREADSALGRDHPFLLRAGATLAEIAAGQGRLEVARHLLEKVVDESTSILPADHADRLGYLASLAGVVAMQADSEEAAALRTQVIEAVREIPDPLEPDVAHVLARVLADQSLASLAGQRVEEACDLLADALRVSQATGWTGLRAGIAWNLFQLLRRTGRTDEADRVHRRELLPLVDAPTVDPGQREVRALVEQLAGE